MPVQSLLITAHSEDAINWFRLGVCYYAHEIDHRGMTFCFTVYDEDVALLMAKADQEDLTVQRIETCGHDEFYPVLRHGKATPWKPKNKPPKRKK